MSDTVTAALIGAGDAQPEVPSATPPLPADRFADRELSWLAFNERVLELAEDEGLPLLERAKFLAIFASNLDEFYMVRVAGLKRRVDAGLAVRAASGLMPRDLLEIAAGPHPRAARSPCGLLRRLGAARPALPRASSCCADHQANDDERAALRQMFLDKVFPVLTPLAVDPAHPFPYISGLSLNLAVIVRNPGTGTEHFARVKVPAEPAAVRRGGRRRASSRSRTSSPRTCPMLFPGMEIVEQHSFRVTRNADIEVEEDDAEDLLKALERELVRRRFGPPVRLEVERRHDRVRARAAGA